MLAALLPVALIAYVVGVFLSILYTVYRAEVWKIGAQVMLVVAWLAHLGAIVDRGLRSGDMPLSSMPEFLLLFGWIVMTLYLGVLLRWRIEAAGLVLPPVAALSCFAAFAMLPAENFSAIPRPRGLFLLHTTVSTLGMATLCVALAMSVIYLIHDRALKERRTLKVLERLPSLEQSDSIGFQALVIGFLLLTLGIVTGVIVNAALYERLWVIGVKQTLPVLAWLVFAAVLVARFRVGFRGRKSAYLTITGVTLGLLTVVGMTW